MNHTRFANVAQMIYCEPAYIKPAMHATIRQMFEAHLMNLNMQEPAEPMVAEKRRRPEVDMVGNMAVISVQGVIAKRIGGMAKMCGARDMMDLDRDLNEAYDHPDVEGILLHIDSPGGSAIGLSEVAELVADHPKPLIAYTDALCASAGYYLAAGADEIVCTKSSCVGCIGVYLWLLDDSAWFENEGLKAEVFKTGAFKGIGLPGTSLTDEQRNYLQSHVQSFSDLFKSHVRSHRPAVADSTMEGQDFIGQSAVDVGLADMVGGFEDALEELQALIDL